MNKHAYIILAHNEPQILATLVRMIDDERNDIFIHIDAKADIAQFAGIKAQKSRLVLTPRVKTYWGGPSQIKAERTAIDYARKHGQYARYHIVSGVDLPIKSQDYIHEFCDVKNPDKEFIGFVANADDPQIWNDWAYYLVLDDYARMANPILRKFCSFVRHAFVALQRLVGFERRPAFKIMKGTQWASISQSMVDWVFSKEGDAIYRFLLHSHCPDEKWLQTLVWNSPYRGNIFDSTDEMRGCMRAIDWKRGRPYVWRSEDGEELAMTDRFFARKFSTAVDAKIIDKIEGMVCGLT